MAQIKLLKIGANGIPLEMDTSADDVTLNSFTVNGGPVLSSSGLDMNNGAVSDADSYAFTDPTSDGLVVTAGTLIADNIMGEAFENSMTTAGAVLFPVISDDVDQVDAFRLPALAGAPSATPSDGGEGYLVWDSSNNKLYAWDGAAWDDLSTVSSANTIDETYTADEALAIRDAVYISAADNVSKADNDAGSGASRLIGFATAAAADTESVNIRKYGVLDGFSGLTAGARQYLSDTAGAITETVPTGAGAVIVQAGYAKSTTALDIQILQLGQRAA